MPSVKETLVAARAVIEDPTKWNKNGLYAADKDGLDVPCNSEKATCFCILGAAAKAAGLHQGSQIPDSVHAPLVDSVKDVSELMLTNYNDAPSTTHADVLAVFDRAIARVSE